MKLGDRNEREPANNFVGEMGNFRRVRFSGPVIDFPLHRNKEVTGPLKRTLQTPSLLENGVIKTDGGGEGGDRE